MKRILIPNDFSDTAKHAIRYGLLLHQGESCICTLLHVLPVMFTPAEVPLRSEEVLHEQAEDAQNEMIGELRKKYEGSGFHFKSAVETGTLAKIIKEETAENKPDLLIMGTRGKIGPTDQVLGSNTSSVARKASCPVLIVPFKSKLRAPERIVFAVDLKHKLNERVLAPLLNIGERFNAEILILQVFTDGETTDDAATGLWVNHSLKDLRLSFHTIHNKDIPEGIDHFVKLHNASMVAIISPHHNFLDRIFHKSVTKNLALHSEIPLLVMHPSE